MVKIRQKGQLGYCLGGRNERKGKRKLDGFAVYIKAYAPKKEAPPSMLSNHSQIDYSIVVKRDKYGV